MSDCGFRTRSARAIVRATKGSTGLARLAVPVMAGVILPIAAHAQQVTLRVSGVLEKACSADVPGDQAISLSTTAPQELGTISYQCNFVGSPSVRLWSVNGGTLVAQASANNGSTTQQLAYSVTLGNDDLGSLTAASASARAITRTLETPGVSQVEAVTMRLSQAAAVAGVYSDSIYLSITP